jgi:hypothetical protein
MAHWFCVLLAFCLRRPLAPSPGGLCVGENTGFQDACFARDAIGFRCVRRAKSCRPVVRLEFGNELW